MKKTSETIVKNCIAEHGDAKTENLTREVVDSFTWQVLRRDYGKLGWYLTNVAPLVYDDRNELRPEVFIGLLYSFGTTAVELVNDLVKFFDEYDIEIKPKKQIGAKQPAKTTRKRKEGEQ